MKARLGLIVVAILIGDVRHGHSQLQPVEPAPMPKGSATIDGVVLTQEGRPAAGATVALKWLPDGSMDDPWPGYRPQETTADRSGHFVFPDVPQASVELSASLDEFLKTIYGAVRPGLPGTPIRLSAGEHLHTTLRLFRGATITGAVLDPSGNVAPGIT